MSTDQCCVVSCDRPLDGDYWDTQYQHNTTGWDLGQVSPPLKSFVDRLSNKNSTILIPGCGNTYEAEYLLEQGFTNVTVIDIAPTLVAALQAKFGDNPNIKVICGDFFEHQGKYDLILEQTFFCALPPSLRQKYVWKMHQLLADEGIFAGLLFNRNFEAGPPFGGNKEEYENLFQKAFHFQQLAVASNSIAPRAGSELFIEFKKNSELLVSLYKFEGITCSGCMNTVSTAFMKIEGVKNVSMSTDFSEVILVSKTEIPVAELQAIVSYDENYKIKKQ
jgi:SAM-dependent methyltransferase